MRGKLSDEFDDLKKESGNHATIDTLARKLYLKQNYGPNTDKTFNYQYGKLKFLLSTFFMIEQHIHPWDKRYDTFLASILTEKLEIPENIFIMTWNYDMQLDYAYREYSDHKLPVFIPIEKKDEKEDHSRIFKINGSANYFSGNYRDVYSIDDEEELMDAIFTQYEISCQTCSIGRVFSSGTTDLNFAWEEDFNQKSKYLESKLTGTDVLVVIGYTFPFFNRKTDRNIFNWMPQLSKIYVQDPNAENVIDNLKAVIGESKESKIKITPISSISNFYLPPEL